MMKTKWLASLTFFTILAIAIPNLFSLSTQKSIAQPQPEIIPEETLEAYRVGLEDAATPEEDEVLDNLTAIKKLPELNPNLYFDSQGRILVISFAKKDEYQKGKPIPKKAIWVTVVPELKEFCTTYTKANQNLDSDALNLRLRQLLGLPPHAEFEYEELAEIWVDPQYLKRPTIDPEIDDSVADIPPSFATLKDEDDKDPHTELLKKQLEAQEENRDRNGNYPNLFPWTGLGYTYDWRIDPKTGKPVEFGLSEFVILLPSDIDLDSAAKVNRVFSPEAYCNLNN